MNAITLGIYPNKTIVYNVVAEHELNDHIEYNITFRPGRLFYVDGLRVCDGCLKDEYLAQYDDIADKFFATNTINRNRITKPYR